MGYELSIALPASPQSDLVRIVTHLPHFHRFDAARSAYEFRTPENASDIPSAEIVLQPDGVYFCDYGGAGAILEALLHRLRSAYGDIQAVEL